MIATAVRDGISGIDLAIALGGISATKSLPIALLTSMDKDHPQLHLLPSNVPVIRKGDQFGDDLAEALASMGIT